MTDNQKFLAGIIIGAAAGTAIALFLQTEKGKEMMNDVKGAADSASDALKQKLASFDEEISSLLKKGKEFVEDLEAKAANNAATAEE